MKIRNLILSLIVIIALTISCSTPTTNRTVSIIPKPNGMELTKGSYEISSQTKIIINTEDSDIKKVGFYLSESIGNIIGSELNIENEDNKSGIIIEINKSFPKEAYVLEISSEEVKILASASSGVFYAIQSLLQIIQSTNIVIGKSVIVPCLKINDEPAYKWRGMHLDVSRHFFPKEDIEKYIDILAMHKLNVFHWHLTDDQGWRIEIKKYPKLTEVGAWREDRSGEPWNIDDEQRLPYDKNKPYYGGFYTQDDVKEIVDYAKARQITIVPEIEMPGHATSMIFSYPELSCKGKPWKLDSKESFEFSDPLCAGNEKTFEIIEGVLSEVFDLFPSKYIHIGGDECKKTPWATCPKCQKRMKEENLKSLDELQSYFIKRIEKFVVSKGRRIIGWDEILEGGLAPEAAVMSWRGVVGGIEAAEQGHEVVMSPTNFCYFDYYQGKSLNEPHAIGGFLPLSLVYQFNPIPEELSADKHHLILGGQGNIWTEHMFTPEDVEYMTYPRIFAMAEVLWTQKEKLDYEDFLNRLPNRYAELKANNINFRMPTPEGLGEKIIVSKDTLIKIINPMEKQGAVIRYTTDGTDPDSNSLIYSKPIEIKSSTCVKARLFFEGSVSNTSLSWFFTIDKNVNGLYCDYFEGEWTKLPDFDKLSLISTKKVYDVSAKAPSGKVDDYALRFKSNYQVDEAGEYTFYLSSDDGSRLFIDGKQIIDYDGTHGAGIKKGKVKLEKGKHKFEILFFESKGGESLEVGTISKSGDRIPIDLSKLFFE